MMSNPLLLEINTRCWLQELTADWHRSVTLGSVPESVFREWVGQGVTHLWLMGVWTTGPLSRARALAHPSLCREFDRVLPGWTGEDVAGSPYAIGQYTVPRALGGENGLQEFRRQLHHHGLKLVLDFVPNHVGLDHRWIREHPEYCVQSPKAHQFFFSSPSPAGGPYWIAHGRDPHFPPWDDTVQLDYRRADVHRAMQGELRSVAARCDGVRCDMAMLILQDVFEETWQDFPRVDTSAPPPRAEFWDEALRSVKSFSPDFLFLAEVYWGMEGRLQQMGFDYTYDKELSDMLLRGPSSEVIRHLHGQTAGSMRRSVHFLENHDEQRVSHVLSLEEHRAAAFTILALPGMRFLHEGQTCGAEVRTPVQLGRRRREPLNTGVCRMYQELLQVLQVARAGQGEVLQVEPAWSGNPTHQNILVTGWDGAGAALAIVNLAPYRSQGRVPLAILPDGHPEWELADQLGSERWIRNANELKAPGLFLDLVPYATQVFLLRPHRSQGGV